MSFIRNFIGNELIDIVEWLDETPDTMVWRFDRPRNEIKNGAQLIVRPSQVAVFVDDAARNPGGAGDEMGAGLGAGMGFGMAQPVGQAMSTPASPPPSAAAHAAGPPPLRDAPQFYIALDGEQAGPFSAEVLRGYVQAGTLTRETLVWRDGMPQWTRAGEVPGVANLFAAVPPPLP